MDDLVTSIDSLVRDISLRATDKARFLVAVAGPPGSGKSTLAQELADRIGRSAAVMPMDGFHLDNTTLHELGLFERKGAPETFDVISFVNVVRAMRHQSNVSYPTFDRQADSTVPDGGRVGESSSIIVIEGNYLLLRTSPWFQLAELFDLTVYLDVARSELETRLIQRWLDHGLSKVDAINRAQGNDLRNADFVVQNSRTSDYTIVVPKR